MVDGFEAVSFFITNKIMTQNWSTIDGKEFRSFLSLFGGDETGGVQPQGTNP